MILLRDNFVRDGIFGTLRSDDDQELCKTLEHAYPTFGGKFKAKIPVGDYMCVRGVHTLLGGIPFETFEVTGIYGHSGILFHPGNRNENSSGCILVGAEIQGVTIIRSRVTFMSFMSRMVGVESFALTVIGG